MAIERIIAEYVGEGAVAMDENGVVTYVNPAALRHLCFDDSKQVVGREFHDLVHGEGICSGTSECVLAQGLMTGAEVQSHSGVFARADATSLPVAYTLTWIADEELHRGAVLAFRDMSRYRDMEARLLTTDRMTAMGTLASGVAHELNNPLAYVKANIRFAIRHLEKGCEESGGELDDRALREALVDSMDGIDRMEAIVAGMRIFSDVDDHVEMVEVKQCLDDALTACGGWLERHADVVMTEEQPLGRLRANAARLTQVFVNLLLNAAAAIEETGSRGEIEVVTGHTQQDQFVEIRDDGVGIDEEFCDQIYDPFFTTRDVGHGTGLGLYICRCIVGELAGRLSYRERPDAGTVFRVALPRECAREQADES